MKDNKQTSQKGGILKKTTAVLLALCILLAFSACGNVNAKEGEPANGFLWENNYNEVTITGYVGPNTKLVIPTKINGKSVTKIESYAFRDFEALESVVIPEGVKEICNSAFRYCPGLKSITIPKSVEKIGSNVFAGDNNIETVYFRGDEEEWVKINFWNEDDETFLRSKVKYNS